MKVYTGSYSKILASRLMELFSKHEGVYPNMGVLKIDRFSDGEILPCFRDSVRNEDVVFINSTINHDAIMETLLVMDAAKRSGCKSFTFVAPFQAYSRQDKTDHLRSSIGAKVMADILGAVGLTTLVTIDLHASSIQGFYNEPVVHLNGGKIFIDYIKSLGLDNLCIVSPDQGAVKRASDFCKAFPEASFAMINKKRVRPNEVHSMELVGEVKDKNVIIVDDMADTLGTMKKASILLTECGAKSVRAVATHGILSGDAIKNLEESTLVEMIVSDTIETTLEKARNCDRLKVVSCDKLISNYVIAAKQKRSIHEINTI